jgi:hypothetical protein
MIMFSRARGLRSKNLGVFDPGSISGAIPAKQIRFLYAAMLNTSTPATAVRTVNLPGQSDVLLSRLNWHL